MVVVSVLRIHGLHNSLGCFSHVKNIDLHYITLHHEETRELPGERDTARNNARFTQARKATHGLDGQHQDMGRTVCGRVNQNDRGRG